MKINKINISRLYYTYKVFGQPVISNQKPKCCFYAKDGQIEKEVGDLFHFTKTEERTVLKYYFSNKELALFLEQFGRGAKNKKIPSFVYDLPVNFPSL